MRLEEVKSRTILCMKLLYKVGQDNWKYHVFTTFPYLPIHTINTVCPRSLDPIFTVTYYRTWGETILGQTEL